MSELGTLAAAIGTEQNSFLVLLAGCGLQGVSGGVLPLAPARTDGVRFA